MSESRKTKPATGAASSADDDSGDFPFDLPQAPAREAAPAPKRSISERALAASRPEPSYLDGLNPEQRAAVEATEGPLLVLAGAGTGKTRVLTTRIAHILASGKAYPSQMLVVTFTNKAAREMRERIGKQIGGAVEGMAWLGTFHAIGVKILRRHVELVGLKSGFTILDMDDQLRLLKQVIEAAGIDKERWPARQLASLIDSWKNKGLTPDKVPAGEALAFAAGKGRDLYAAYQSRLKDLNACDFGDLLLECLRLFREHPDVLASYHKRFRYILVDEYQDTNIAQYLWLRMLAQGCPNVCCVGDDDQSIYGWRGAEVDNILRFDKDFPGAKIIRLERNYRSTGNILAAASGLIAKNEGRLGKTLFTDGALGEKVSVANFWDDEAEARSIGEDIEQLQRQKCNLNDVAILVRASFQMRVIEDRFITLGLPYRVIGGPRFYERQEIKDAIAYLEIVANPSHDLKFERIVNVPKRGLGDTTVKRIHELARARGVPMYQAAREIMETDELANKARRSLFELMQSFERWRSRIPDMRHTELAELILDESGYTAMWQADKSPQAQSRLENLKELVRFMHDFESLAGFLEHVSLVMDVDQGNDGERVSLMTLHAAKGLEFGNVFLPGWEEGLFPHQRSLDESGKAGLEEERRLAYVGVTRAKKVAKISFAQNRRNRGLYQSAVPSRFVDELPEAHVAVAENQSPYGGITQGYGYGNTFGTSRFDNKQTATPFASGYQTPGWQRAQQNWSRSDEKQKKKQSHGTQPSRPLTIDGELVASSAAKAPGFKTGTRIRHDKFGDGTVTAVDGNKLTIDFDDGSSKRLVASFVDII
ncbi:MAG: UvrD-helicase domain-containing protein [Hyphomicrobium sp.]|nr:UvrD-helicase domain-containing protein [Hyphomicrobium sp.]